MFLRAIVIAILSIFLFNISVVFAESSTTPTASASASTSSLPVPVGNNSNANSVITAVEAFISNLEKLSGGFVFSTPNVFSDSVTLSDGTVINGLSTIRNIFIPLAIPITAILIFWIGGVNIANGKLSHLKPFIGRIVLYAVLSMTFVTLMSYTITVENALTNVILQIPNQKVTSLSSFTNDFYTQGITQINNGKSTPESLGIYNTNFTSLFQSMGYNVTMMVLGVVTILALVLGVIFILSQFALRFLGLLFLSLIFPLVLPFVLTEKTQGIFTSYLRVWFTFLIHQPAFALGYVIVMLIAKSILLANGASLGLLFLYIASLFFLGTINILASRIFADAWVALGASVEAQALAAPILSKIFKTAGFGVRHRDDLFNGAKSIGQSIKDNFATPTKRVPNFTYATSAVNADYGSSRLNPGIRAGVDTIYANPSGGNNDISSVTKQSRTSATASLDMPSKSDESTKKLPVYAREFENKGFSVEPRDSKNGIYSLKGKGYSYYDAKNNISHTFPSKRDALDSGYTQTQIRPVTLSQKRAVDLSQFKTGNPHNASATQEAVRRGMPSNFAHITKRSDAIRIKHNLEMNDTKFKNIGVNGYLTKHYDNPNGAKSSKRPTTRIVSLGKEEE